jgi:hypothetical protein
MKPIKRQVLRNGVMKWKVDFGIVHGHRKRSLVNTEADADELVKNFKREAKASGELRAGMSESERLTTTATIIQIKDAG